MADDLPDLLPFGQVRMKGYLARREIYLSRTVEEYMHENDKGRFQYVTDITFREQIFGKKSFLHTSLKQFLFKICTNIH